MYTSDKEAIILEHIYYNDSLKQRELADKAGISLGMTNVILKRLIEKGWIITKRLNSRNISYVVQPVGIEELFKRGYRYFKQTIDDVKLYKEKIEQLVSEAASEGFRTIALIGKSDLDFIIEYACGKLDIAFNIIKAEQITDKHFVIYGEQYEVVDKIAEKHWLRTIIMKRRR